MSRLEIAAPMNTPAVFTTIASFSAVIAALVSGFFTRRNTEETQRNALKLEQFKQDLSHDVEQLKAKLGHGQIVSSTQWNAEFDAQALHKPLNKSNLRPNIERG
jgi:hypothetical protein